MSSVHQIPVLRIHAGNNDRKTFNSEKLHELANSIREHGLAQPITVRPHEDGYEVVAGERRFRAIRDLLRWEFAPCLVKDLTDEQAAGVMLAENTARVDLNPIEEAESYQARIDRFGWGVQHLAEVAGVTEQRVRQRLQLLTLVDDIQHLVKFGNFPEAYALSLVELDANRQRIALKLFNSASSMPLHRWRDVVGQLREQQAAEAQLDLFSLELKLVEQVTINDERPCKGLNARTGAKGGKHLPPVRFSKADRSMGRILDRYIRDLLEADHEDAAGAVANLYNVFVARGWVFVPDDVLLPKTSDAGTVADELHEVIL